jgi:hypothetical protein
VKRPHSPAFTRVTGSLEDDEGHPAGGSRIRIFRDLTLADALVGNAAGGLVGNAAGGLVSGQAGVAAQSSGMRRRTLAVVAETVADAEGRFEVNVPDDGRLALLASVDRPAGPLMTHLAGWTTKDADRESLQKLRMTPPGRIEGQVAVDLPQADLLGIDIFVPGTDLIAKTNASGSFAFSRVPAGRHVLVAQHPVLGPTGIDGVMESSNTTTRPGILMIRPERPRVVSVEGLWFPGGTIRLHGEGFRLAEGKVPQVFLDGLLLTLVSQGSDSLTVRLPPSWTEGRLFVTVDGRPGEPVAAPTIAWALAGVPGCERAARPDEFSWSGAPAPCVATHLPVRDGNLAGRGG